MSEQRAVVIHTEEIEAETRTKARRTFRVVALRGLEEVTTRWIAVEEFVGLDKLGGERWDEVQDPAMCLPVFARAMCHFFNLAAVHNRDRAIT